MKLKSNTETLCDDNGIEIIVGYEYDREKDYEEEPGNPATLVQGMIYTELTSVEVVIAGIGVDVLPSLTSKQIDHLIGKLNYD